jgi:RNase P protein component
MIKKIYRLKERELKKVLKYSKPFFSYGIVLNVNKNKLNYNRFAIVLGSKSVKS